MLSLAGFGLYNIQNNILYNMKARACVCVLKTARNKCVYLGKRLWKVGGKIPRAYFPRYPAATSSPMPVQSNFRSSSRRSRSKSSNSSVVYRCRKADEGDENHRRTLIYQKTRKVAWRRIKNIRTPPHCRPCSNIYY